MFFKFPKLVRKIDKVDVLKTVTSAQSRTPLAIKKLSIVNVNHHKTLTSLKGQRHFQAQAIIVIRYDELDQ